MRYSILIILLSSVLSSFINEDERKIENFLANTEWRSSGHAFADKNQQAYAFTEKENEEWIWGTFIKFTEDTFSGYYSAPCGNDCFVYSSGTYKFLSEKEIFVNVNFITRSAFCENSGTDSVGFKARYSYTTTENSVKLVKVN